MITYLDVTRDVSRLPDFLSEYQTELEQAKKETSIHGNLERNLAALPGITEYRFGQLQNIESVLNFLNIQQRSIKQKYYKKYLESYGRALSSRDAERYADAEQEVIDMDLVIAEVALLRNQYLSVIKALESKNFMLGHITRLRAAGLESISI
jgi:hypothetical protein